LSLTDLKLGFNFVLGVLAIPGGKTAC